MNSIKNDLSELSDLSLATKATPGISYSFFEPNRSEFHVEGFQTYENFAQPLAPDNVYDLASLTKVIGVTTRLLQLLSAGEIRLDQRIGDFVSNLASPDLTIEQLMCHRTGLQADIDDAHSLTRQELIEDIKNAKPIRDVDSVTEYSDLNYILLGWALEVIDGSLEGSIRDNVTAPLGMNHTEFKPNGARENFVPSEKIPERGGDIRGIVHDYKGFLLDGVCGHAGLFSTLRDLTVFARAFTGEFENSVFTDEMRQLLSDVNIGARTLGWRRWSNKNQFWHTGFTGTSIAVDLDLHRGFVCLTNRIYPSRENRKFLDIRAKMHAAFYETESSWPL